MVIYVSFPLSIQSNEAQRSSSRTTIPIPIPALAPLDRTGEGPGGAPVALDAAENVEVDTGELVAAGVVDKLFKVGVVDELEAGVDEDEVAIADVVAAPQFIGIADASTKFVLPEQQLPCAKLSAQQYCVKATLQAQMYALPEKFAWG